MTSGVGTLHTSNSFAPDQTEKARGILDKQAAEGRKTAGQPLHGDSVSISPEGRERLAKKKAKTGAAVAVGNDDKAKKAASKKAAAAGAPADKAVEVKRKIKNLENEIETLRAQAGSDPKAKKKLKEKRNQLAMMQAELAQLKTKSASRGKKGSKAAKGAGSKLAGATAATAFGAKPSTSSPGSPAKSGALGKSGASN